MEKFHMLDLQLHPTLSNINYVSTILSCKVKTEDEPLLSFGAGIYQFFFIGKETHNFAIYRSGCGKLVAFSYFADVINRYSILVEPTYGYLGKYVSSF